jgi:peroxiredoxin Q/BCP
MLKNQCLYEEKGNHYCFRILCLILLSKAKIMKYLTFVLLLVLFGVKTQAQKIEDFTISSVTDKSAFTLSKSKGKFVALHFLLKTECPYCIRHTSEYFEKATTLPNVVQVFIKPDGEKEIKEWANKLTSTEASTFPIYQDKDARLADQFNIPSGYQFHGQIVHYPALILLNEKGEEVFRYVGKNNSDRFSFDKLKAKIEELKNQ